MKFILRGLPGRFGVIIIIMIIIIIIGQTSLPNESPPTWINDIFQVLISFCGDNALRISK